MTDRSGIYDQAIADLVAKIEGRENAIRNDKRIVNQLCAHAGRAPIYPDVDAERVTGATTFRRDHFYGKPLATAIREYLVMRGPSDRGGQGAATVNEIYDALAAGGFRFETKDALNAKRGLRIALSKNTQTFHRVPSGSTDAYGLLEWYPNAKAEKPAEDKEEPKPSQAARLRQVPPPSKKRGRPPKVHLQRPRLAEDMTDNELEEIAARADSAEAKS